jgi:hypothetical protein
LSLESSTKFICWQASPSKQPETPASIAAAAFSPSHPADVYYPPKCQFGGVEPILSYITYFSSPLNIADSDRIISKSSSEENCLKSEESLLRVGNVEQISVKAVVLIEGVTGSVFEGGVLEGSED